MYAFLKKKKWLILLSIMLLTGLAAGGKYVYHRQRIKRVYARWKADGIAASQEGQHQKAVELLRDYLSANTEDQEALRAYVHSRPLVEAPGDRPRATLDVIFALRQLIRLESDTIADRHQLIELCQSAGQDTEVCDEADGLLSLAPGDLPALSAKTAALLRLHKWAPARDAAVQWTAVAPEDVQAQMMLLLSLQQLQTPREKMIDQASQLRAAHPGDARFELLEGFALTLGDKTPDMLGSAQNDPTAEGKTATQWFRAAAAHPPADVTFVRALANQFDQLSLFSDSLDLLRKVDQSGSCPPIRRDLLRRLWEAADWPAIAAIWKDSAPQARTSDGEVAGIEADALRRVGQEKDAQQLESTVAANAHDPMAVAWAHVLNQPAAPTHAELQRLIEECGIALESDPVDAPIHFIRANTFERLGNSYLAIAEMQNAASCAMQWAVPLTDAAMMQVQRGEIDAALASAETARRRVTSGNTISNPSVAIVVARVAAAAQNAGRPIDSAKLMEYVRTVQQAIPGEPYTREIQIWQTARGGDLDGANALLKQAIESSAALDEAGYLKLATLSRQAGLGLEDECFSASQKAHGLTPTLVFARALAEVSHGNVEAGAKLIEEATHTGVDPGGSAWRLTTCSYMELTGNPNTVAAWTKMGDELPSDLAVQKAALTSPAAADPAFLDRTIERLQKLTGPNASEWRLARSSRLLGDPKAAAAQVTEAATLVDAVLQDDPGSAEAHRLKSVILTRQGDPSQAKQYLLAASDLDPTSPRIAMELVPVLLPGGNDSELRNRLQHTAEGPHRTPEILATLGWLYDKDGLTMMAESSYRQALKLRPGVPAVENNLAMVLINSRSATKNGEAVELAKAAAEKDPKNSSYFDTLAQAQWHAGDVDGALKSVATAIGLAPGEVTLRLNQIDWLISAGHAEEARTSLDALEKMNGGKADTEARQRIISIRSRLASAP